MMPVLLKKDKNRDIQGMKQLIEFGSYFNKQFIGNEINK